MELDKYQQQRLNRIADNLYAYAMRLNDLKNRSNSYSDIHFTHQIATVLDSLTGGVITDIKELELYSERKAEKEAKNHAKK
jgi:hypothetical protein